MRVVIAGGHGKIALLLEQLLTQRGHQAVALIRNPAQADEVSGTGAMAAVCDLEAASADEVAALLDGAAAEDDLRARDLDWTILRPGGLTDEPGTGRVRLQPPSVPRGQVPRADVAAVILALLDRPATAGQTLELVSGDVPVADAVRQLG